MEPARVISPVINPRRACAARVTVVGSVCLSVCLSVKSHLTYGASVRPEIDVTYSAGNEGGKLCGVFSETAPLQRSGTSCIVCLCAVGYFPAESAHAHCSIYWCVFLFVSLALQATRRLMSDTNSFSATRA